MLGNRGGLRIEMAGKRWWEIHFPGDVGLYVPPIDVNGV